MVIQGKSIQDHLFTTTRFLSSDEVEEYKDVECECDVKSTQVFLEWRSEYDDKYPNRPYLHIMGKCEAIRCVKPMLPYDISQIGLFGDSRIDVDIFYEFSDEELAELVKKGLFHRGFKTPDIFKDNTYEMPVTCSFMVVTPQEQEDIPLVFVDIEKAHDISVDTDSCGYVFADYFEVWRMPEFEDLLDDVIDVHENEWMQDGSGKQVTELQANLNKLDEQHRAQVSSEVDTIMANADRKRSLETALDEINEKAEGIQRLNDTTKQNLQQIEDIRLAEKAVRAALSEVNEAAVQAQAANQAVNAVMAEDGKANVPKLEKAEDKTVSSPKSEKLSNDVVSEDTEEWLNDDLDLTQDNVRYVYDDDFDDEELMTVFNDEEDEDESYYE